MAKNCRPTDACKILQFRCSSEMCRPSAHPGRSATKDKATSNLADHQRRKLLMDIIQAEVAYAHGIPAVMLKLYILPVISRQVATCSTCASLVLTCTSHSAMD